MSKPTRKPAWFILYALVILMIAAFVFENKDGLPTWANEFADVGIILFVFGAMLVWVRLNSSALWEHELRNIKPGEYSITEYLPQKPDYSLQDELDQIVHAKEMELK